MLTPNEKVFVSTPPGCVDLQRLRTCFAIFELRHHHASELSEEFFFTFFLKKVATAAETPANIGDILTRMIFRGRVAHAKACKKKR